MNLGVVGLFLSLLSLSFAPAMAAEGRWRCEELLRRDATELSSIRTDFEHNTNYSIEVKRTGIKDQCQSRSCWVFSGVSNLEQGVRSRTGRHLELSEEFLIVHSIRMKVLEALENPGQQFSPGGLASNVDWLAATVGLVPRSVWSPRIDFKDGAISKRFYYFLNARIAQYHMASARDPIARERLLEEAKEDLLSLIESYTGPLPERFDFEGQHYSSPVEFAKEMLPWEPRLTVRFSPSEEPLPESIGVVVDAQRSTKIRGKVMLRGFDRAENVSIEEIALHIRNALERGESVRLSYESVHEFIDQKTGVMSIEAFHVPVGFQVPPRRYRSVQDFKGGGHAVEVVGVDIAPDGRIVKFKIKNSHGLEAGDRGYFHMYWDYFAAFVKAAYVRL